MLKPAEVLLLARYRERFAGRVVEIGCGGGRLLGYLVRLARRREGIDISPAMVRYCRAAFPEAAVDRGDLRALDRCLEGSFDVVLVSDNILDMLDDRERRRVLSEIGERYLIDGGLLVFSTHNLAYMDAPPPASPDHGRVGRTRSLVQKALDTSPAAAARGLARGAASGSTGGGWPHCSTGPPTTRSSTTRPTSTAYCTTTYAAAISSVSWSRWASR